MSLKIDGAPDGLAHGSVVVGTTATLIVPARKSRRKLLLPLSNVWVGAAGVTPSYGFPLMNSLGLGNPTMGLETADALYGVTASGSATVQFLEFFDKE